MGFHNTLLFFGLCLLEDFIKTKENIPKTFLFPIQLQIEDSPNDPWIVPVQDGDRSLQNREAIVQAAELLQDVWRRRVLGAAARRVVGISLAGGKEGKLGLGDEGFGMRFWVLGPRGLGLLLGFWI